MSHYRKLADYIRLIKHSIGRFVTVGAVGFVINFCILSLLYKVLDFSLLPSQLIAAEVAILSSFFFHNGWTYKDAVQDSYLKRFIEFHGSSWLGSAMTTFTLVFLVDRGVIYVVALSIGAAIALVWNFFWTRFVIWRPKETAYAEE